MSTYRTARCPRCGHVLDGPFYEPCPVCAKEGHNLNHITEFDLSGAKLPGPGTGDEGIFRFREFYAIGDGAGFTRSLSQAAANGLYVADLICAQR